MGGRLDGKVALITGSSRGLGLATAQRFAREGAIVAINYRNRENEASALAKDIERSGGKCLVVQADVSVGKDVSHMVKRILSELKQIDILVNNAGIFHRTQTLSTDERSLDEMIQINMKGAIHCVEAVAPEMKRRKKGKIINVSSISSMGTAVEGLTPYAATKGALNALTKRWAFELGAHGINVNAICPGVIPTDMPMAGDSEEENRIKMALTSNKAVLKRIGTPDDVAYAALFLAGDESNFITGQILSVDGGRTDYFSHST